MEKFNLLVKTVLFIGISSLVVLSTGCSEEETSSDQPATETPPVVVPDPYHSAGWYARTEVTATASDGTVYSHTTAGVFGELIQSSDDQDQHDIPGYGPAIFQVIFLPDFSTDTTAGYFSEYKHYDENYSVKKSWTFLVKNQQTVDLSNAPIRIDLSSLNDVKYRDDRGRVEYKELLVTDDALKNNLHLVDIDNQVEYTVDELETANLTMNGLHTRTFRWVLGSTDSSDYAALPASQRSAGRVVTPEFQAAPAQSSGGKFGLPPQ